MELGEVVCVKSQPLEVPELEVCLPLLADTRIYRARVFVRSSSGRRRLGQMLQDLQPDPLGDGGPEDSHVERGKNTDDSIKSNAHASGSLSEYSVMWARGESKRIRKQA